MLDTIYTNENKDLRVLINSKSVLQNISYKLANDKNSVDFFENLISNIENYESLERMKKYHFDNDCELPNR